MNKHFMPYLISTLINILIILAFYYLFDRSVHNAEGRLSMLEQLPTNRREQQQIIHEMQQMPRLSASEASALVLIIDQAGK